MDEKSIWPPKSLRSLPRALNSDVMSSKLLLAVSFVPTRMRRKGYVSVGFMSDVSPSVIFPNLCSRETAHSIHDFFFSKFWDRYVELIRV